MVINIIVARFLAPEKYGIYSLVLTYVGLFYFVASLGLSMLTTRSVSRDQDNSDHYFRLSMILRAFGFALSVVVFLVYAAVRGESFSTFTIFAILGGVFLESVWDCQQNVAFGMQRMEWNTIVGIAASLLNLLIYVLMPRTLFTVNVVLGVYMGIYLLKNAVYYFCLKRNNLLRNDDTGKKISSQECISYVRDALPFYLMYLLGIFTGQLPVLFLNSNAGVEQVAYFNIANKLLLPISLFMTSAFSAFFPNQSKLFEEDRKAFSTQTKKVLVLVTGIGVALGICVTLFKGEVVYLLYGDDYACASNVMAYQCWYTVMYGVFCLNGNTLGAADAQKRLAICSVIYALISTPILYFLSKNGAEGLSLGYLLASILNLLYILPVLKITVSGDLTWKVVALIFFGLVGFTAVSLSLSYLSLPVRIAIFVIFLVSICFIWKKSRSSVPA